MVDRQRTLAVETLATGPQLDRLVDGSFRGTTLHRHTDVVWTSLGSPINGFVENTAMEYLIDSLGFVHIRGEVDGSLSGSNNTFLSDASFDFLLPVAGYQGVAGIIKGGIFNSGMVFVPALTPFRLQYFITTAGVNNPPTLNFMQLVYWPAVPVVL